MSDLNDALEMYDGYENTLKRAFEEVIQQVKINHPTFWETAVEIYNGDERVLAETLMSNSEAFLGKRALDLLAEGQENEKNVLYGLEFHSQFDSIS